MPEYSCGTLKAADGTTDLYYRMVKPVGFDATKKYPTVVYVYGGPHAHNVDARWHYSSRSWETYMAQKGYLLLSSTTVVASIAARPLSRPRSATSARRR